LVGIEKAIDFYVKIVGREGRRYTFLRVIIISIEGEDAEVPAHLRLAERSSFAFAESPQLAGAALDDSAGNVVRQRGRFGAGAFRIGKDVEISERARFDEGERGRVVFFRFARKTGDDVGADGSVREAFVDSVQLGTSDAWPQECGLNQIATAYENVGRVARSKQKARLCPA